MTVINDSSRRRQTAEIVIVHRFLTEPNEPLRAATQRQ
jgi:hypothetical protein